MRIDCVIGAGYGDEGKGLSTSFFCSQFPELKNKLVIRYNGGAQAGHTVVFNGKRHVFAHFGSGSLQGIPTFLSQRFICNPLLFKIEHKELDGYNPRVYVDGNNCVSTPFDMIINRIIEEYRGDNKHGSVGVGIHETLERHKKYPLLAKELWTLSDEELWEKLIEIRCEWIPERLAMFGISMDNEILKKWESIYSDHLINNFINDCQFFVEHTHLECPFFIFDHLIFEGAQGLLLDKKFGSYPHVTPSRTGMRGAMKVIKQLGYQAETINAWYITRCYTTKHGAGILPNELENRPFKNIKDNTNINNTWQGSLRFSYLNFHNIMSAILLDSRYSNANIGYIVTCTDQVSEDENVKINTFTGVFDFGKGQSGVKNVLDVFKSNTLRSVVYYSTGPECKDIKEW